MIALAIFPLVFMLISTPQVMADNDAKLKAMEAKVAALQASAASAPAPKASE